MHRPPAVSYKVVRSRWHFFVIVLLWLFALVGALAYLAAQGAAWHSAVLAAGLVVSAGWSLHSWYRTCPGLLQWDGEDWYGPVQDPAIDAAGTDPRALRQIYVVFDFQVVMLVRASNHGGRVVWFWLEQATAPELWLRLRRALVGSARGAVNERVSPGRPHAGDA